MNVYLELTGRFNEGRVRAILAGGQAAVLHRLAFMSKDGDWILREEQADLEFVLAVLDAYGARYRYGAPLDARWLAGGWSSHLEFRHQEIRVRTDFVTRPPRIDGDSIRRMWYEVAECEVPFVSARDLAEMKKTNREKDYVVIGELARRMTAPGDQVLCSRSARDLIELAQRHPDLVQTLATERPLLGLVARGREVLEAALDAERRQLIRASEERLARYLEAARRWASIWSDIHREIEGLPLLRGHELIVRRAEAVLPFVVPGGWP